jgi:hypothetical protein
MDKVYNNAAQCLLTFSNTDVEFNVRPLHVLMMSSTNWLSAHIVPVIDTMATFTSSTRNKANAFSIKKNVDVSWIKQGSNCSRISMFYKRNTNLSWIQQESKCSSISIFYKRNTKAVHPCDSRFQLQLQHILISQLSKWCSSTCLTGFQTFFIGFTKHHRRRWCESTYLCHIILVKYSHIHIIYSFVIKFHRGDAWKNSSSILQVAPYRVCAHEHFCVSGTCISALCSPVCKGPCSLVQNYLWKLFSLRRNEQVSKNLQCPGWKLFVLYRVNAVDLPAMHWPRFAHGRPEHGGGAGRAVNLTRRGVC